LEYLKILDKIFLGITSSLSQQQRSMRSDRCLTAGKLIIGDNQEEASQQIKALGLRLVDATDGEEVKNSSLLYINGHEARLRC
jgi:hypothetical protein